jgi:hypothetical protein
LERWNVNFEFTCDFRILFEKENLTETTCFVFYRQVVECATQRLSQWKLETGSLKVHLFALFFLLSQPFYLTPSLLPPFSPFVLLVSSALKAAHIKVDVNVTLRQI